MRIVDVCEFYSPTGGGIRSYVDRKMQLLAEAGHELIVLAPGAEVGADRDDAIALYRHIGHHGRTARAIDDGAAANHQIVHLALPLFGFSAKPIIKFGQCK